MNKQTSISKLFEALTANMSTAEIKASMVISDISSRIEKERINMGLSQKDFAKYLGVSQGMVSKWESGDYNFTIESIANIFDKLNLDFEFTITSDLNLINVSTTEEKIDFDEDLGSKYKELLIAG